MFTKKKRVTIDVDNNTYETLVALAENENKKSIEKVAAMLLERGLIDLEDQFFYEMAQERLANTSREDSLSQEEFWEEMRRDGLPEEADGGR